MGMAKFIIRAARPDEITALRRLIVGLAEYEKLAHLVVGSEADLNNALFGPGAHVEAVLLHVTGQSEPAGFALYFHNFSTFLSRRGLYLEDLFVVPAQRGNGYGRALLLYLARLAKERGCGRFEW